MSLKELGEVAPEPEHIEKMFRRSHLTERWDATNGFSDPKARGGGHCIVRLIF